MYVLIVVLILIVAVLTVLVVLVQNSKGGGLASNFAGSNQYMGVRKTADFLEKATWGLAITMLLFVLISSMDFMRPYQAPAESQSTDTEIRKAIQDLPVPTAPVQNQGENTEDSEK
jgi:preprotein translocase subunit SecG